MEILGPISGVSKHWNNGLYREIIETDWNMKKIYQVRTFHLFRNVLKQNWNKLWKRWKYQTPFLVFRNTETVDYIGKLLKRTETWRKLAKSERFSFFETKLKQAQEKVKIPGPISCLSKYWNSGIYREIIETNWNMKKIDLSQKVSVVSKRFKQEWNKLWKRWKY